MTVLKNFFLTFFYSITIIVGIYLTKIHKKLSEKRTENLFETK